MLDRSDRIVIAGQGRLNGPLFFVTLPEIEQGFPLNLVLADLPSLLEGGLKIPLGFLNVIGFEIADPQVIQDFQAGRAILYFFRELLSPSEIALGRIVFCQVEVNISDVVTSIHFRFFISVPYSPIKSLGKIIKGLVKVLPAGKNKPLVSETLSQVNHIKRGKK